MQRFPSRASGNGYSVGEVRRAHIDVLGHLDGQLQTIACDTINGRQHVVAAGSEPCACARHEAGIRQLLQQLGFVLHRLTEAADDAIDRAINRAVGILHEGDQTDHAIREPAGGGLLAQVIKPGNRVTVRRMRGVLK